MNQNNTHKIVLLVSIILFTMTGCKNNRSNGMNKGINPEAFSVNVDSIIKEELPLNDISGIVYIANVSCSKCVLKLFDFLDEVSELSIDDALYLAVNDTAMLNILLQSEYAAPESIDGLFSVIGLDNKLAVVQCNGTIVKKTPGEPLLCIKYQPGYFKSLFNH